MNTSCGSISARSMPSYMPPLRLTTRCVRTVGLTRRSWKRSPAVSIRGREPTSLCSFTGNLKIPPGHRTVLEFGIENRALQYLVHHVLSVLVQLHPDQYLLRGGVHEAIKQTRTALSDGFRWAVEIDISNCYPSFDESKLANFLPLPKEVTDSVIISGCLNLIPGNLQHYFGPADDDEGDPFQLAAALANARRGISQGSAASPLVAEAVLAISIKQVPKLGVIIAYADNILLLAKSESDVVGMTEALLAALEEHPVGRLRPSPRTF